MDPLKLGILNSAHAPRDLREGVREEIRQLYVPMATELGLVEIPRQKGQALSVLRWGRPDPEDKEPKLVFYVAGQKLLQWTAFLSDEPWPTESGYGYTPEQLALHFVQWPMARRLYRLAFACSARRWAGRIFDGADVSEVGYRPPWSPDQEDIDEAHRLFPEFAGILVSTSKCLHVFPKPDDGA
jgi:hypothetical protein